VELYKRLAQKHDHIPNSPIYSILKLFKLERRYRVSRHGIIPKEFTTNQNYSKIFELYKKRDIDALITPAELLQLLKHIEQTSGSLLPIIEMGCFKCGTTILIAKYLELTNDSRNIIACDSFEGSPPDFVDYSRKPILTDSSKELVKKRLSKYRVEYKVTLVPGYFEDTIPIIHGEFSLMFLDSNTYESGKMVLEQLGNRVHGIIITHDYYGMPIQNAVDEFLQKNTDFVSQELPIFSIQTA